MWNFKKIGTEFAYNSRKEETIMISFRLTIFVALITFLALTFIELAQASERGYTTRTLPVVPRKISGR